MGIRPVSMAGWHLGMTSAVEADLDFEKGEPMNSALLIKNFNPNIVLQSLIMRPGTQRLFHEVPNDLDGDTIHISSKYPVREYLLERSTINTTSDNMVLGTGMIETTRPTYFKSPLIFIRDIIEGKTYTNIVSGIIERGTSVTFKWHDIWNLEKEEGEFADKGIRVQGELEDWYGYANLVVLTTTKSKSEWNGTKLYPVYVYAYDDRGKYLKYNFMPFDVKALDTEATWKVRKPSQFLFEPERVRQIEMLNFSPIFTPIYVDGLHTKNYYEPHSLAYYGFGLKTGLGYYETLAKAKFSNWNGSLTSPYIDWSNDPESKPPDSELAKNRSQILTINQNYSQLAESVDIIFWQTDQLPAYQDHKEPYPMMFTRTQPMWNFFKNKKDFSVGKDDFHLTVEKLNHWIEPYARVNGHAFYYYDNGAKITAGHNPTDSVDLANGFSYYAPMDKIKVKIKYKNTDEVRNVNMYPAFMGDTVDRYLDDTMRSGYKDLEDRVAEGYFTDADNTTERPYITFCLPKYVEKELPRYWLAKEEIPYVLTAIVGGIEVEIKRGKYEIPNSYEFPALDHPTLYKHINYWTIYGYDDEGNSIDGISTKVACTIPANTLRTGNPYTILHNQSTHMHASNVNGVDKFPKGPSGKTTGGDEFQWDPNLVRVEQTTGTYQDITHTPYLTYSRMPYTMFTLRFNFDTIDDMLSSIPAEITEFRMYISAADTTTGLIDRTIDGTIFSPADMGYAKPVVQDNNDNQYRLIKRFIIRGEEGIKNVGQKWSLFNRELQGSETFLGTNNWTQLYNSNGYSSTYNNLGGDQENGIYAVPEGYNQTRTLPNRLNFRNIYGQGIQWTPDFYIWDYATSGTFLSQNLVATGEEQIWKGTGARLLTVTRGATVIAGCQNEFFEEEEGIVRVSLVQNGNISNDLFPEVNKLYVGRAYFTAIANFSEQIILFSNNAIYRVILNDLTNPATWEVFDAIDGQGTLNQKTVVVTPYGVCFANNNSIWFTDGSKVNNIGKPIEYLYRSLTSNSYGNAQSMMFGELPGGKGLQLVYESKSNELHCVYESSVSSIHFIYNFEFQNWRVNEIPMRFKDASDPINLRTCILSNKHKTLYDGLEKGIIRCYIAPWVHFNSNLPRHANLGSVNILYFDHIRDNVLNDQIPILQGVGYPHLIGMEEKAITGVIITHDVGDGINDYLLEDCIIEAYPKLGETNNPNYADPMKPEYVYDKNNPDPILQIAPRHLSNANYAPSWVKGMRDIIQLNMGDQWFKFLHRTSPTTKAPSTNGYTSVRESFIYKSPFGISFRKSVFMFKTHSMSMVRTIQIKIREMQRKIFS